MPWSFAFFICLHLQLNAKGVSMPWTGVGLAYIDLGMVDRCRLPSDDSDCGILEDAYCILKLLEVSSTDCSLFMVVTPQIFTYY